MPVTRPSAISSSLLIARPPVRVAPRPCGAPPRRPGAAVGRTPPGPPRGPLPPRATPVSLSRSAARLLPAPRSRSRSGRRRRTRDRPRPLGVRPSAEPNDTGGGVHLRVPRTTADATLRPLLARTQHETRGGLRQDHQDEQQADRHPELAHEPDAG